MPPVKKPAKKVLPKRKRARAAAAPPAAGAGAAQKAIVFTDMADRDDTERQRLEDRQFELEQIKAKNATPAQPNGVLPPELQAELDEINDLLNGTAILDQNTGAMNGPVVDPLFIGVLPTFIGVQATLRQMGVVVGNVDSGKLPSQQGQGGASLTPDEMILAAVYGISEVDSQSPSDSQRFVPSVSKARGEYTASIALFTKTLPILIEEGDVGTEIEIRAEDWVRVVRTLNSQGVKDSDSLLSLKTRIALGNVVGATDGAPASAIVIDLPDLEAQSDIEIIKDNLYAMQAIYFAGMLEELKVFQVVEKLLELFQFGMLPLGRGNAGNYLYGYWKNEIKRLTEPERRGLYSRAFGFPGGDATQGSPNREFTDLWLRFVSAITSFNRQLQVNNLLVSTIPVSVNQQQIRKSGRDLAANLSLHAYGIAYFAGTELQTQIRDVIALLSDPDIKTAYGARDMWQVIDQVATLELGGAKNSIRYRTMATAGAIIIRWLGNHAVALAASSYDPILDVQSIQNPYRATGTKPTIDPSDYDLVNACDQWLAVNGIVDQKVEDYSQPTESPAMTSRPIQIPSVARDLLESVGVPAGLGGNGGSVRK